MNPITLRTIFMGSIQCIPKCDKYFLLSSFGGSVLSTFLSILQTNGVRFRAFFSCLYSRPGSGTPVDINDTLHPSKDLNTGILICGGIT